MATVIHQGSNSSSRNYRACLLSTVHRRQSREPGGRAPSTSQRAPRLRGRLAASLLCSRHEIPTATHQQQSVARDPLQGALFVFRFDILQATSWPHILP